MTNFEQARRRLEIAEACNAGATLAEAAEQFQTSVQLAKTACKEYRVRPKKAKMGRSRGMTHASTLQTIARLQQTTDTQTAIAESAGLTPQRVSQIYIAAREAGIKFPNREKEAEPNAT